jgi:hypothetical protein
MYKVVLCRALSQSELRRVAALARKTLESLQRYNQWVELAGPSELSAGFIDLMPPLWELADLLAPTGWVEPFGSPPDELPAFPPEWSSAGSKLGASIKRLWLEVFGEEPRVIDGKVVRPKGSLPAKPLRGVDLLEAAIETIPTDTDDSPALGDQPKTASPATEPASIKNTIDMVNSLMLDENAARVAAIASGTQSADQKMRDICDIDQRYYGCDSSRWADLLGVKSAAIRKTKFWTVARPTFLNEARETFRAECPDDELPGWMNGE